jgi:hypothetical protein
MAFKYFNIAWTEFANGQNTDAGNLIMYTSGPTNFDELKRNVRTYNRKPENAVIVLLNVQPLDKATFKALGGKSPE